MNLTAGLAIGFLTILILGLAIGASRVRAQEQAKKTRPRLVIEKGYRSRREAP